MSCPQFKAQGVELKNIRKDKPEDRVNVTAGVKAACETIKECVFRTEVSELRLSLCGRDSWHTSRRS